MSRKSLSTLVIVLIAVSLFLISCAPFATQVPPTPEIVKETVIVKETSLVTELVKETVVVKETVLVTQLVEKIVTPTPEPLPEPLRSSNARDELFDKFQKAYNLRDNAKLYSLLDPLIQIQIPRDTFDQQMSFIYPLTDDIEDGVFASYEFKGIQDGWKWFLLYYKLATEQGPATLIITIAQENGGAYKIAGFHINREIR